MTKTLTLGMCLLLSTKALYTCDGCQCRVATNSKNKLTFTINFRYTNLGQLYGRESTHTAMANSFTTFSRFQKGLNILHGGEDLLNGSYERYVTINMVANYRLTDRWMLSTIVPVSDRSSKNITDVGSETSSTFGLGDAVLLAGFGVYRNSKPNFESHWTLQAGVKLPTGKTNARTSDGDLVDMHIQSGSGSVDYLIGLDGAKQIQRWEFISDVIYRWNSVGARDFQFGDFVNYRFGARYELFNFNKSMLQIDDASRRLRIFGGVNIDGEWEGREHQNKVILENTGGHTLLLSPNIGFQWSKFTLGINYEIPIMRRLQGRQLGQTSKVISEMSFYL